MYIAKDAMILRGREKRKGPIMSLRWSWWEGILELELFTWAPAIGLRQTRICGKIQIQRYMSVTTETHPCLNRCLDARNYKRTAAPQLLLDFVIVECSAVQKHISQFCSLEQTSSGTSLV